MCYAAIELCLTGKPIYWYLEHPKQGETGVKPWQNWSEQDFLWETAPGYIRGHSPTGRKARYFFGKTTNVHQGVIVFTIPIWKQGDLFYYFGRPGQTKLSKLPFFCCFLKACPFHTRCQKPNPLSNYSGLSLCLYRPMCSQIVFKEHLCSKNVNNNILSF